MASFDGFQCDICNQVFVNEIKTRVKISFTGFKALGEFYQELCPQCVLDPEGFTPVKTRRKKKVGQPSE